MRPLDNVKQNCKTSSVEIRKRIFKFDKGMTRLQLSGNKRKFIFISEIASSGLAKPTDPLKMPRSYGLKKEAFGHKTCFFLTFIILSYFSTGAFTSSSKFY